jgi:flagellar hook assembly protein FlgD
MYSNNDLAGLENVKHLGKFYLMNNDERFLSYGIWATEENYQLYLDEFEESAKSLSIENSKPVDLHSLFSRYTYPDIEVQLTEGSVRPEIVTPSIINSVAIDENSKTISMNVTEPNGNSFLVLNSGDLIAGPHSVILDGESVEGTTLSNESGEYLMVFYDQPGNHQVTITGTAVIPEFGSLAVLITAAAIAGAVPITKYLQRHSRRF